MCERDGERERKRETARKRERERGEGFCGQVHGYELSINTEWSCNSDEEVVSVEILPVVLGQTLV